MNYTENYQLPQWQESDRVRMADFNSMTQKIDAGLAAKVPPEALAALQEELAGLTAAVSGKSSLTTGTYMGDGTASRTIALGFSPKAVLVVAATGHMSNAYLNYRYGGLALTGFPVTTSWDDHTGDVVLNIVDGGFQVHYNYDKDIFTNASDIFYHYVALQ